MSRDEAHGRATARRSGDTGTPADRTSPGRPLCTVRTDRAAGTVRVRGHLDEVGAEALCRVVAALRQLGHRHLDVDLGTTTLTDDARALLTAVARPAGRGAG
ncbi:hypothetical protein SAMN05660690_3653 [Geodermatophilus telluris]|uniref:STAS domain-containing protein n=1 Tax=Geodermatophilus telluris TaxID=1190417 RepID=A0A1G6SWG5_9ACTN|nr:hypothetical protein [Geodermatophilus telluris]SDD21119.1 hypothetical protein SAMN05660690_3653 [Geodermatophilus telluris]